MRIIKNLSCVLLLLIIFSACEKSNNSKIGNEADYASVLFAGLLSEHAASLKYVNASAGLRVRDVPDINAERIAVLNHSTEVIVIKEEENDVIIDGVTGKWTFIESGDIKGWVFGGYLLTGYEMYLNEPKPFDYSSSLRTFSSSDSHTLVIMKDGSLWAWGENRYGQLGNGRTDNCLSPVQIGRSNDWHSVSAGDGFSIALKTDGSLWAWGYNRWSALGDGTTINRHYPIRIGYDADWSLIAAGGSFTMAIKKDGSLWAWGNSNPAEAEKNGRRGGTLPVPTRIGSNNDWVLVSTGEDHSLLIKKNGSLWIWGYAGGMSPEGYHYLTRFNRPEQVGTDEDWVNAIAGYRSSLAIKKDSTLWAWGETWAILVGYDAAYKIGPQIISDESDWNHASNCYENSIALKKDGSLWAWGTIRGNQYYDDDVFREFLPFMVYGDSINRIWNDKIWSAVYTKDQYAVASTPGGSLWAWGVNDQGQLGDGTTENKKVPVQINFDTKASQKHYYPENNTVTFSLERINGTCFKLFIEGAVFTDDIESLSYHLLETWENGRNDQLSKHFKSERNSDTEVTITYGTVLFNSITIRFNRIFDYSLAIQGDPLIIKNWKYQTAPGKNSIIMQ